jgi:hypothetical protein
MGLSEVHETSRGGEHVLIRPARPKDLALYRDFLADVTPEDLRLRFFGRIAELTAAEADKLSHLDYSHDMAFVALDEGTGRMVGLVRLKDELDEKTAEFAILVRSHLKGHGIGWLLMRASSTMPKKNTCGACMRTVGGKRDHAADVRRTRLPNAGYGIGDHTCRPRSRKARGPLTGQIPVAKHASFRQGSHPASCDKGYGTPAVRRGHIDGLGDFPMRFRGQYCSFP